MDPNNLDPNDMEELQKQLAAVLPGQDALSGMSTADQAQFTEALLGSMGSTFEGMFSGGEDGPFGQLMKSIMTAGMQFGKQLTDQNPEVAEVMGFDESQEFGQDFGQEFGKEIGKAFNEISSKGNIFGEAGKNNSKLEELEIDEEPWKKPGGPYNEYVHLRGCYRLDRKTINKVLFENFGEETQTYMEFAHKTALNDAVFGMMLLSYLPQMDEQDMKRMMSVNEVRFVDCPEITDRGIEWLVALLTACRAAHKNKDTSYESECTDNGTKVKSEDIFTVKLTSCPQITEKSLMSFLKLGRKLELEIKACDIGFLPESSQLTESLEIEGCPLLHSIEAQNTSKGQKMCDLAHALIVPSHDLEISILAYLKQDQKSTLPKQKHSGNAGVGTVSFAGNWGFHSSHLGLTEIAVTNPLFNELLPRSCSQVVVAFSITDSHNKISNLITITAYKIVLWEGITFGLEGEEFDGIRLVLLAVDTSNKGDITKLRELEESIAVDFESFSVEKPSSKSANTEMSDQKQMARLIGAQENLRKFARNWKHRVKWMYLNTETGQGLDQLKTTMEENVQIHRKFKSILYRSVDSHVSTMIDMLLSDNVRRKTYLTLQEIYDLVDGIDLGRLKMIKLDKILRLLHDWGQIKYKSTEPPTAVLDMNWYTELLTLLAKSKSDVAESYTSCLKRGTPVCRDNKLIKTVEERIAKEKMGLFLEFLQDDGFIVLSLTRNSMEDPRFCMIHPGNLLETPAPMEKYLTSGEKLPSLTYRHGPLFQALKNYVQLYEENLSDQTHKDGDDDKFESDFDFGSDSEDKPVPKANGFSKPNERTSVQEKRKYVLSRKAAEAVAQETGSPPPDRLVAAQWIDVTGTAGKERAIPVIATEVCKLTHPVMCGKNGIVIQQNAAQISIGFLKFRDASEKEVLTVQASAYLGTAYESFGDVNQYVWNLLHIYCDITKYALLTHGVVVVTVELNEQDSMNYPGNKSICSKHLWVAPSSGNLPTVCTFCNQCVDKGILCKYSGIMGRNYKKCKCNTHRSGCRDCGLCHACVTYLWKVRTALHPSQFDNFLESCDEKIKGETVLLSLRVPLDPYLLNETSCTFAGSRDKDVPCALWLFGQNDSTLTKFFPGEPVTYIIPDIGKHISTIEQLTKDALGSATGSLCAHPGDRVAIRIREPNDSEILQFEDSDGPRRVVRRMLIEARKQAKIEIEHKEETKADAYEDDLVMVNPGKYLLFEYSQDNLMAMFTPKATFTIANKSTNPILFKLQVTSPKRYRSVPNMGFLRTEGETVAITITLVPKENDPTDVNKDKFKLVWMELTHPELQANGIEFQHLFEGDPNYTKAINTLSSKPFPHKIKLPTRVSLKTREAAATKKEVKLDLTPSTPVNGYDPPPDLGHYKVEVVINGLTVNSVWLPRDKYLFTSSSTQIKGLRESQVSFSIPKLPSPVVGLPEVGQYIFALLDSRQMKFHELDNSHVGSDTREKINIGLNRIVNVLTIPGNKVYFELAFQSESEDGTLRTSDKLTDSSKTVLPFVSFIEMFLEDQEHVGRSFLQNLNLPPNMSRTMTHGMDQAVMTTHFGNIASLKDLTFVPTHFYVQHPNTTKYPCIGYDTGTECGNFHALFPVQEARITHSAPVIRSWKLLDLDSLHSNYLCTFLPDNLDDDTLAYPHLTDVFNAKKLRVHQLCKQMDSKYVEPIHFIDASGEKPSKELDMRSVVQDKLAVWVYHDLAVTKMRLPSYKKLLQISKDTSRSDVEQQLHRIVKIYAATGHLLSTCAGGIKNIGTDYQYSNVPSEETLDLEIDPNMTFLDTSKVIEGMCKAHYNVHNMGTVPGMDYKPIELDMFEPYGEFLTHLSVNLQQNEKVTKTLPNKIPDAFPGLLELEFVGADLLEELPENLSLITELENLSIRNGVSKLRELPVCLGELTSLEKLLCYRSNVKEFPAEITKLLNLKMLGAHSMELRRLPDDIGKLERLTYLDISQNPLWSLPESFGNLRSLETLKLSGIPWMTGKSGLRTHFDKDKYLKYHEDRPQNLKFLKKQTLIELFERCDLNHDNDIDQNEAAELNAQLFYMVPRIGFDYEEWDDHGGIPEEIFKLRRLQHLDLSYTAIRAVPQKIVQLRRLQTLNLNHCMLLESLSGELGKLPITSLSIRSCPSLRTPPPEVVARGQESVIGYLKRLSGGFTENWRTKLMLVGLGGAGKTRALISGKHKSKGTAGEQPTDGISIKTWTVKAPENKHITYSAWDFAGQNIYYNTHQFFLSNRAVYLLLWTTRQGFEHAGLEFWLSSIMCHAPKAPIFVVATHYDQVKADLPRDTLQKQYPQIKGFHYVSSLTGYGIKELEAALLETTIEQSYMGERIPTVYLELESKILRLRREKPVLDWTKMIDLSAEIGLIKDQDVRRAILFLHDLGTVQYFDNEFLRDNIVINPQWIVDVMACVVSINSPIQNGKFSHGDIGKVWGKFPSELHNWLLRLTETFDLTFPVPHEPVNIVPCLLPQDEPQFTWPVTDENSGMRESLMIYKFSYLPAGLFNRTQVRLFQFSDGKAIWKRGSLLKKNNHIALVTQISDRNLLVKVHGPRPENILFLIHEVLESLITESFHGVKYDYRIPCPDCIAKSGAHDPYLFKASNIREAAQYSAPFLQCRKFYHIVSMPMLQALMPPEGNTEFDLHMHESMHRLHELRSNFKTDIFVSVCCSNVPKGEQSDKQVDPKDIVNRIRKEGYSCWYNEQMDEVAIHESTIAIKDSKLMLVFMSNEYVNDPECSRLFLYAKDTLNKSVCIIALGKGQEAKNWQKTPLGMSIGPQEVFIALKSKEHVEEKMSDLLQKLKTKLQLTSVAHKKANPEVFLSYCWSNSRAAVKLGTREQEGAVGVTDPRDIKTTLEKNGLSCWLDIHESGKKGLFEDIAVGIKHCKVVVACVSKQYAMSTNCMMEVRFAACTMNKPIVIAVVGTDEEWQWGELGILIERSRAPKVDLQTEKTGAGLERLVKLVKNKVEEAKVADPDKNKSDVEQNEDKLLNSVVDVNKISFMEEFELAQRKLLRYLTILSLSMTAGVFPHLVVLDFASKPGSNKTSSSHNSGLGRHSSIGRPPIEKRVSKIAATYDGDLDFLEEDFCIRVLCEHEQGWHTTEETFPVFGLNTRDKQVLLQLIAPYLGRIFALLSHSGVSLNLLHKEDSSLMQQFEDFLREHVSAGQDFSHAYCGLREMAAQYDVNKTNGGVARCHLPTGKISWLCKEHQKGEHVTIMNPESTDANLAQPMTAEDDLLLKSCLEKYIHMADKYRPRKGKRAPVEQKTIEPGRRDSLMSLGDVFDNVSVGSTSTDAMELPESRPGTGRRRRGNKAQTIPDPTRLLQGQAPNEKHFPDREQLKQRKSQSSAQQQQMAQLLARGVRGRGAQNQTSAACCVL